MNIKTWYGTSVKIPTFDSYQFNSFAASCIGLVRSVLQRKLERDIFVSFCNIETAAVNRDKGIIYISEKFLAGIFGKKVAASAEKTLSIILGITVHEAGHLAYSPPNLEPFVDYIRNHTTCLFHEGVALGISNTLEDIFIEHQIHQNVPVVSWMVDAMNDIMMNEKEHEEIVKESRYMEEPPVLLQDVIPIMNLILQAKIYATVDSTPYLTVLFNEVKKVKDLVRIEDRFKLCLRIYDSIMCNVVREEKTSFKTVLDAIIGFTAGGGEEVKVPASNINRLLEELKDAIVELDKSEEGETLLIVEQFMPLGTATIEIDKRYLELAQFARQRTAVNKPYGLNQRRGHTIRNLYRIATDQKIFSEIVEMDHFTPMQVIILVDCSGSMCADSGGKTRLQRAMEAAAGATYGLMEGNCEVAVYGHSADILTSGDVHIYKFKEFCEPVSALLHRFPDVDNLCRENRDGNALQAVAEKFRGRKRKLLIVISDGIPQAAAYYGPKANQHCWRMVNKIRKKGITVLSISITSSAAAGNDFIYGAENNVFNEDPNCIEQIVRKLLE